MSEKQEQEDRCYKLPPDIYKWRGFVSYKELTNERD